MDEQAGARLNEVLANLGHELLNNRPNAEAVLQKELADTPGEQGLLLNALRAGIPAELIRDSPEPMVVRLGNLTQRLSDLCFLQQDAARWSVETWAIALGILTPDQCERFRSGEQPRTPPDFGPSQMSQKPIIAGALDEDSTVNPQVPLSLAGESELAVKAAPARAFDISSSAGNTAGFVPVLPALPLLREAIPAAQEATSAAEHNMSPVAPSRPSAPAVTSPPAPVTNAPPRRSASAIVPWALLAAAVLTGVYFLTRPQTPRTVEGKEPPVISGQNPTPSTPAQGAAPAKPSHSTPAQGVAVNTPTRETSLPGAAAPKTNSATPPERHTPSSTQPVTPLHSAVPSVPQPVITPENKGLSTPPSKATPAAPVPSDSVPASDITTGPRNDENFVLPDAATGDIPPPVVSLTEADLAGKSLFELNILRNEPYARHGYRFRAPKLLAYFHQKPWYHPMFDAPGKVWNRMDATERHNVNLVRDYQVRNGMRVETEKGSSSAASIDALMQEVSRRTLTPRDLTGKTPWELRLLRNMPYALHGYRFRDPALRDYFQERPWYHPISGDHVAIESQMTRVERRNTEFIRQYQQTQRL